jgi:MtfA peptidase
LLRWLRPAVPPVDALLWEQACSRSALLSGLSPERAASLRQLSAQFLAGKTITPVAGLTLTAADHVLLAALCCLPLQRLGRDGLRGWSQLIVYPEAFGVRRSHVDAAGVMHEWDDELIGEAWDAGPLVLSWADVLADLEQPDAGFCVVIHEMAHKVDALDGAMDGTPPLPGDWQRAWARDFQTAYDRFCAQVDADQETAIDPYAAEAPEEFFAVTSEYHFSAPAVLAEAMPAVAAHLERYYGRSPMAGNRLTDPAAG